MKKKGFIFDLDGVIVDTAKYHYRAWKTIANQLGIEFTEEDNEKLKGVSRKRSLDILLSLGNVNATEQEKQNWMDSKNEEYLKYIRGMNADEVLPDVPKVLDFLITKKQPIALGSASKNAKEILSKINLISKFNVLVDGNEVTKAKPDPEVFVKGALQMGVAPEDCVVFEDAAAGIEAAKSAGMIAIAIGEKENLPNADYYFNDFTEIETSFLEQV